MEEFLGGLFVGWLLFGKRSHSSRPRQGLDVGARLNAYSNRKRFERLRKKAAARGFEREFQEQWQKLFDSRPFHLQYGFESTLAFREAEAMVLGKPSLIERAG